MNQTDLGAPKPTELYDGGRAPNPRRVRIFMAEKAIELPIIQIDIAKKEHKTEGFTRLNPMQRLPVLVLEGGAVITESVAICRYLEELYPEPNLFGRTPLERAEVVMWNRRVELGLFASVAAVFRHLHPFMAEFEVPQIAAWGEANKTKVAEQLAFLDSELDSRRFIAGERFTIADITALCAIEFMKPSRLERPAHLLNLARWWDEVSARPSIRP
ncbi:MAG: glutathione S-transferase [Hyphomicrobiaceae bacterium]|nr:glutathione S-transferase [Hyphomicrobiaceae bacterium]